MSLRTIVFLRRNGALGLGHVGWAFELRTGWFSAGAVENIKGAAYAPPQQMDLWTKHTLNPINAMLHQYHPYNEYKVFTIPQPRPWDAWETILWISQQPFIVLTRNCVDDAYDVLRAYGDQRVLLPSKALIPNVWYDRLPGETNHITPHSRIALIRLAAIARLTPISGDHELIIPVNAKGKRPAWRHEGTAPWKALQEALTLQSNNEDSLPTP